MERAAWTRNIRSVVVTIAFVLAIGLCVGGVLAIVFRELRRQTRWLEATRGLIASGLPGRALIQSVGPSRRGSRVFTIVLQVQPSAGDAAFV